MHVASIYVLIPVQNIAEIFATLYSALYSASVFCTGMSTSLGQVPADVSNQSQLHNSSNRSSHRQDINDGDSSTIKACLLAGLSTSLGFGIVQALFNVLFPAGKCWID